MTIEPSEKNTMSGPVKGAKANAPVPGRSQPPRASAGRMFDRPFSSASVAAAICAAGVYLIVKEISGFERDIFDRLMFVFHVYNPGLLSVSPQYQLLVSNLFGVASFFLFGLFSNWAGFKLAAFARLVTGFQLFAVSLIYQCLVWKTLGIAGHPIGYSLSIIFGLFCGAGLRQLNDTRKVSEARYYELKIRNNELNQTRLSLVKQNEVERRMLAADLHDQVLNDMKQLVHRFEGYVEKQDADDLQRVRSLSAKVMHEIREVMESLCPSVLEHLGLVAALEDCLRKGAERSNFKVRFRSKIEQDDLKELSVVEQSLLYRLVQESITNICKHAEASTVRIVVEKVENFLLITINDDGKGLDPAKSRQDSRGLKYMRLRADLIGATIAWKGGDNNRGTKVEIRMDLSEKTVTVGTDDH